MGVTTKTNYKDFVDACVEHKQDREDTTKSDFERTSFTLTFHRGGLGSMYGGRDLITLDREDIAYFYNKYAPKVVQEMEANIKAVKEYYSGIEQDFACVYLLSVAPPESLELGTRLPVTFDKPFQLGARITSDPVEGSHFRVNAIKEKDGYYRHMLTIIDINPDTIRKELQVGIAYGVIDEGDE